MWMAPYGFQTKRCRMSSVWERADAADQSRPGEIYFHVGTGPHQLCRRMAVYTQQAKGLKKWQIIEEEKREALLELAREVELEQETQTEPQKEDKKLQMVFSKKIRKML